MKKSGKIQRKGVEKGFSTGHDANPTQCEAKKGQKGPSQGLRILFAAKINNFRNFVSKSLENLQLNHRLFLFRCFFSQIPAQIIGLVP